MELEEDDVYFLDDQVRFIDMTEKSFLQYCQEQDLQPRSHKVLDFEVNHHWKIEQFTLHFDEEEDSIIYDMYTHLDDDELHVLFQSLEILDEKQIRKVSKEIFHYIAHKTSDDIDT